MQKNGKVLENSISTDFKLFTTIKERIIVKLSRRQEGRQASTSKGSKASWRETKMLSYPAWLPLAAWLNAYDGASV